MALKRPIDDTIDEALAKAERRKGFINRLVDLVPAPLQSKIVWLATSVGTSGVLGADQADPDFSKYLLAVVKHPTFWFMSIAVLCAALIIYFRWRDGSAPRSWT